MHFIKHQPGAFVWNEFVYIKLSSGKMENIKFEVRESFQTFFGAKLLNQIDNAVIIQNKVWYQLTYRFRRGTALY